MMYNTVLLATALQDWERYSAHALTVRDVAAALALGGSKKLHVLSIYHYDAAPPSGLSGETAARYREDQIRQTDILMQHKIDGYVAPLKDAGLEIEPHLEVGNAREVILHVARDIKADLLVIGSHSKRNIFDVALGGTARQISSQAPCPVVLVSPQG